MSEPNGYEPMKYAPPPSNDIGGIDILEPFVVAAGNSWWRLVLVAIAGVICVIVLLIATVVAFVRDMVMWLPRQLRRLPKLLRA